MGNNEMKIEIDGYVVKWCDYDTSFEILKDGVILRNNLKTINACQEWINKRSKQRFKRMPVLCRFGFDDNKTPGEATSIIDGNYAWVVSGHNRNKERLADIWLDTPENRKIMEDIEGKNKQIKQIDIQINNLKNSAARLTAEMMIDEGGDK